MLEYNTCSRCALGRPIDCRATLRLDYASGKFKHIALVPGRAVHVRALLEDPRGPLWIGTDTGLWQLDPLSGSVTKRAMGCLGINETTVRTRLYRAQRRLRIDWTQHAPAERSELFELTSTRGDHIVSRVLGRLTAGS